MGIILVPQIAGVQSPFAVDASGNILGIYAPDGTLIPSFGKTYTWATLPAASSLNNAVAYVSDIAGGSYWRSNGTRWIPQSGSLTLGAQNTDVSCGADTNEDQLYSLSLPGGLPGPNDKFVISGLAIGSGTGSKTLRIYLGNTAFAVMVQTTNTSIPFHRTIRMRNSVAAQISEHANATGPSAVASSPVTGTENTANPFVIKVTGQKATSGDVLTLSALSVELVRAP